MILNNDQVAAHIRTLVGAFIKDKDVLPNEAPVLEAGVALITNFLQCINDIAWTATEMLERGDR